MHRLFSALVVALLIFPRAPLGQAGEPEKAAAAATRVFVCAHSFMIYTAKTLPPMAQAAGIPYTAAGQQMIGGSNVSQHWDLPDGRNKAKEALQGGQVDVLTLAPNVLMPDPGIENFTRLGLEKNSALRVYLQASWSPLDGTLNPVFRNEMRNEATLPALHKMQSEHNAIWRDGLEKQAHALNATLGRDVIHIIPADDAVNLLRELVVQGKVPGIAKQSDLFRDALGHPQPPLATLVTYCHFATIFGKSPVGLPVPTELKGYAEAEKLNLLLQNVAWEAVTKYPFSGVKAVAAN